MAVCATKSILTEWAFKRHCYTLSKHHAMQSKHTHTHEHIVRWMTMSNDSFCAVIQRCKKQRMKPSASVGDKRKKKCVRQQTNINLSMIYCVFNTRFDIHPFVIRFIEHWIASVLQNNTPLYRPRIYVKRGSSAWFEVYVTSIFLLAFSVLSFKIRSTRPFYGDTLNHLCLLNFPFLVIFVSRLAVPKEMQPIDLISVYSIDN